MTRLIPVGLGLVSSLLLWLAYFPVNWGFLGWIGLTPLLLLSRLKATRRARYFSAWLGGIAFFLPAISWMRVGDPMMYYAWIALSLHCSVFVLVGFWLIRRLDRFATLPLAMIAPLVWTAMELLRDWVLGGFPWYFLGHTQHDVPALIQIADLTGVYGVTFVVAAVNGLIADAMTGQRHRLFDWTIVVAGLLITAMSYGTWRLGQSQFADGPRVVLLQGNTPQSVKNDGGQEAANQMLREYEGLMNDAMRHRPDLAIWPETSYPGIHVFPANSVTAIDMSEWEKAIRDSRASLNAVGAAWQTPILIGVITANVGPGSQYRQYNSAIMIAPNGEQTGRYDKIHRVPFGEYIPFVESLPWLSQLSPYDGPGYTVLAGTQFTRFSVPVSGVDYRFGVLICYEDSDSALARAYVAKDPVDFLVNISNDGWFKGTQEHEQHLAVSRFRAVECRRSLVRAVNMGISGVIDSNGQMVRLPGATWASSKAVAGVVAARVPIDHRSSIYAWAGDWLPLGCWLVIGALLLKGSPWLRRSP